MKILVVSHEYPPIGGGGSNACYYLTSEFAKNGHIVHIVTAKYKFEKEEEISGSVYIHRVNSLRKHKEYCNFLEMLSYLCSAMHYTERLHRKIKFDVCLSFFGIPSGPIGYVLHRKYDLPYIIRFGGGDIPGFQKRFVFIYRILGPAIRKIWDEADTLVANSLGLKKMALDYYSTNDFRVICNGVDTQFFKPIYGKDRVDAEEVTILFVSRLIERKGLQFFLPTLANIIEKTQKRIRLVVVGEGPYKDTLLEIVKKYKLDRYVEFVGHKNRDELLLYYQNADVFIFPSKKEGMPNVVLEAMSSGLPIIMTPCEGAEELIKDNGYISEISRFEERVEDLIMDEKKRKEMGMASRQRAIEMFSWETTAGEYLEVLKEVWEK